MPPPEPRDPQGPSAPGGFRHLGDEIRFEGWRIDVVQGTFQSPEGDLFQRDIVRHPGAVAVVPLTDHATVVLIRQYRPALDRWVLEIPAGTRDVDGEPPEVTAARELEEEVGLRAKRLEYLTTILNSPGFCDEVTTLFTATGLAEVPHGRHGQEEEHIEVVEVSLADVDGMVSTGELCDAQSVLGVLLARDRMV